MPQDLEAEFFSGSGELHPARTWTICRVDAGGQEKSPRYLVEEYLDTENLIAGNPAGTFSFHPENLPGIIDRFQQFLDVCEACLADHQKRSSARERPHASQTQPESQ